MKKSAARDAELAAAQHMRQELGFADAAASSDGADGGIDVHSERAVAQVKLHFKPVGRVPLQHLFGARASATDKRMIFYSYAGYSSTALAYADSVEMALFSFSFENRTYDAENEHAHALIRLAKEARRPHVREDPHLVGLNKEAQSLVPQLMKIKDVKKANELSEALKANSKSATTRLALDKYIDARAKAEGSWRRPINTDSNLPATSMKYEIQRFLSSLDYRGYDVAVQQAKNMRARTQPRLWHTRIDSYLERWHDRVTKSVSRAAKGTAR